MTTVFQTNQRLQIPPDILTDVRQTNRRETDRRTRDRQTDVRQTDRQTDVRHTDRQTDVRQTDGRETDRRKCDLNSGAFTT